MILTFWVKVNAFGRWMYRVGGQLSEYSMGKSTLANLREINRHRRDF